MNIIDLTIFIPFEL